jgi:AraC-like DNA-binding protein
MKVADLAGLAHMGVSTFHKHFKAVASMSLLQYQKALRLQEARRRLAPQASRAAIYKDVLGKRWMGQSIMMLMVGFCNILHFSRL